MSVHWIFFLNHSQFFFFSFFSIMFRLSYPWLLLLTDITQHARIELTYGILLESIFSTLSVVNKMDDCKLNEPNQKETIFTQQQTIQPFHQISSMKWSSSAGNSGSSSTHHMTWYDTSRFLFHYPYQHCQKYYVLDLWSLVFHLLFDTIHNLVCEWGSAFCYIFLPSCRSCLLN